MVCFKCNGSGLKPCKQSQLSLKAPCPVCGGIGHLTSTRQSSGVKSTERYRPFKDLQFKVDPSYINSLEDGIILTSLCGYWFVHQIEHGHKVTTDDYIAAAVAVRHFHSRRLPTPTKYLDLGTGLGSVLMLVTSALNLNAKTTIHGVEIQDRHVQLARKSLALNSVKAEIFHSDLRDFTPSTAYDLITGTPPYFPTNTGSLPISSNRAQCAFEVNGDVSDYLSLASKCLAKSPLSRIIVANGGSVFRTLSAGRNAGFECVERIDVHGKVGKDVLFSVYVFRWIGYDNLVEEDVEDVFIRDSDGEFNVIYRNLVDLVLKKNLVV